MIQTLTFRRRYFSLNYVVRIVTLVEGSLSVDETIDNRCEPFIQVNSDLWIYFMAIAPLVD